MTPEEWAIIEKEFPEYKTPTPPVCTAHWDLNSWRKWYQATGIRQCGEWIQRERNGFWKNQRTGEESLFHPMAIAIGDGVYRAYRRFHPKSKKRAGYEKSNSR